MFCLGVISIRQRHVSKTVFALYWRRADEAFLWFLILIEKQLLFNQPETLESVKWLSVICDFSYAARPVKTSLIVRNESSKFLPLDTVLFESRCNCHFFFPSLIFRLGQIHAWKIIGLYSWNTQCSLPWNRQLFHQLVSNLRDSFQSNLIGAPLPTVDYESRNSHRRVW